MTYVVKMKDGSMFNSIDNSWSSLPDGNIESITIYDADGEVTILDGYDIWFFSDKAVAYSDGSSKWLTRTFGGFYHNNTGEIVTLNIDYDLRKRAGSCVKELATELVGQLSTLRAAYSKSAFRVNK